MVSERAPHGIDPTKPHPARRYNYWLGGKDHFAADRDSADTVASAFPTVRLAALENRSFLQRAVRYLADEAGIRQFLDIGTGLPSAGNVHEIAQGISRDSRVVYVDNDRVKPGCSHMWAYTVQPTVPRCIANTPVVGGWAESAGACALLFARTGDLSFRRPA